MAPAGRFLYMSCIICHLAMRPGISVDRSEEACSVVDASMMTEVNLELQDTAMLDDSSGAT